MALAKLTRDVPSHIAARERSAARIARKKTFEGVPFESLTPVQKDAAIKELLIRAGLIPES